VRFLKLLIPATGMLLFFAGSVQAQTSIADLSSPTPTPTATAAPASSTPTPTAAPTATPTTLPDTAGLPVAISLSAGVLLVAVSVLQLSRRGR